MSDDGECNERQRNATDSKLTPKQNKALDLILQGKSITEVAKLVGVDRSTIHRWQNDIVFEAEINRLSHDLRNMVHVKLERMAVQAIDDLEIAFGKGNPKVALDLLKGLGYLDGKLNEIGSSDASEVQYQKTKLEKQTEYDHLMDSFTLQF